MLSLDRIAGTKIIEKGILVPGCLAAGVDFVLRWKHVAINQWRECSALWASCDVRDFAAALWRRGSPEDLNLKASNSF